MRLRASLRKAGRVLVPDTYDITDNARPTREGTIGTGRDRSKLDLKSSALGQYPYADSDEAGRPVLASTIRVANTLNVTGRMQIPRSGSILVRQAKQWKLHHVETFIAGTAAGWSATGVPEAAKYSNAVSSCSSTAQQAGHAHLPAGGRYFLGPFRQGMKVTKRFKLPADHTRLLFQANVHFIDKWDQATLTLRLNGAIVWQRTHSSCSQSLSLLPLEEACKSRGVSACGGPFPDTMAYHLQHTVSYFSPDIRVTFESDVDGKFASPPCRSVFVQRPPYS